MLSKLVCEKCAERKKLYKEEADEYSYGGSKVPSFDGAWKTMNIVVCPVVEKLEVSKGPNWVRYQLPITSACPPDCFYQLEQFIDNTPEEETLRSRIHVASLGEVLSEKCEECKGTFHLQRTRRKHYLCYKCNQCGKMLAVDQRTGELIKRRIRG